MALRRNERRFAFACGLRCGAAGSETAGSSLIVRMIYGRWYLTVCYFNWQTSSRVTRLRSGTKKTSAKADALIMPLAVKLL
jgi:hypothetical protein